MLLKQFIVKVNKFILYKLIYLFCYILKYLLTLQTLSIIFNYLIANFPMQYIVIHSNLFGKWSIGNSELRQTNYYAFFI